MDETHHLPFRLESNERLEIAARTQPALLAVTDRRMIVASDEHVALDLPVAAIRRIQLDVERDRPATLVIVPHDPAHEPQVLAVPHEALQATCRAVAIVGARIGPLS